MPAGGKRHLVVVQGDWKKMQNGPQDSLSPYRQVPKADRRSSRGRPAFHEDKNGQNQAWGEHKDNLALFVG